MRSGIILAGGRSTRFGGGEKSLREVGGRPMICRVKGSLDDVVDEIIVSVRDEKQRDLVFPYLKKITPFVYDEVHDIGPLAGVNACLKAAKGEYVVVVACDMPFISPAVIDYLFKAAEGHNAAVPVRENGFIEPLHAVYRREAMIAAVDEAISQGKRRIASPLDYLKDVVYVPVEKLREIDPDLKTFINVNRAEDMPPEQ
ncbi:molybdenum cofactor guanylyltransferase [Methanocella sp. MCL-LM]|uniref:molybdenum cofactor guanylyltransferase n=1 Tax=Methanocella sp. MCL-LM TaxID=3412035 RepID=UPI003C748CFB